jgi:hypothetical protein
VTVTEVAKVDVRQVRVSIGYADVWKVEIGCDTTFPGTAT